MDYFDLFKNTSDIQSQLDLIKSLIKSGIDLPSELYIALIDVLSEEVKNNKNLEVSLTAVKKQDEKTSEEGGAETPKKKSSGKKVVPATVAVKEKEAELRAQISEAANTLIRMNKKDVVTKVLTEQKVLSLDQLPTDALVAVNSVFVDNIFG